MSRHLRSYRGAGVLLFRQNKDTGEYEVLLGKRSIPQGYGKWAIPGGGMERHDTDYKACAFRELWEETGIDINLIQTKYLDEIKTDIPFFHWRTYLILTWEGFPQFRIREFSELKWIPLSDLDKYDLWVNLNRETRVFTMLCRKIPNLNTF